ncbi:4'-phosphopantetheinyl transferase superfamily protein [Mycobacterium riyadhense]|uniref:Acyl carrier protein n=1 Tax=Mycobacterium riyadhense TaxID=486698 RepID=A0A653ETV1_9MYCO|nr:4'-phosphopantetheinyl transferase superfamily protein [Mycobacterium riyadhense]VTP00381.1 acyl carrier protein [Mycobacterium riyadhense]
MITLLATTTTRPLDPAVLTADESARLATLAGEQQRRQWLTSRRALRLLLGLAGLPPETARYTFPHPRISLSHTERVGAAAVVVDPTHLVTGVGIDVEPDRDADPRAARFFLDRRAQAWLATLPIAERRRQQVSLWTVKEALFKADMNNERATLRDYALVDPTAATGCAVRNLPHEEPAPGRSTVFGYTRTRLPGTGEHLCMAVAFRRPTTPTSTDAPTHSLPRRNMSTQEITFDEVAERISATLSIPLAKLTPTTTLADLAADSFMLVEAVVDLQEEFDTMFTQTQLREVTNLGELVELLQRSRVTSDA